MHSAATRPAQGFLAAHEVLGILATFPCALKLVERPALQAPRRDGMKIALTVVRLPEQFTTDSVSQLRGGLMSDKNNNLTCPE